MGGTAWTEPAAIATYVTPRRLAFADLRYWVLRWSDKWNEDSLRRFVTKWDLDPGDQMGASMRRNFERHRWDGYWPYRSPIAPLIWRLRHRPPRPLPDRILQPIVCRWEEARRAKATPRLIHTASRSKTSLAR